MEIYAPLKLYRAFKVSSGEDTAVESVGILLKLLPDEEPSPRTSGQ